MEVTWLTGGGPVLQAAGQRRAEKHGELVGQLGSHLTELLAGPHLSALRVKVIVTGDDDLHAALERLPDERLADELAGDVKRLVERNPDELVALSLGTLSKDLDKRAVGQLPVRPLGRDELRGSNCYRPGQGLACRR